ncbi:MAG: hypothetical protein Unbinned5350contig1001_31 [Prokaryotic dsDNA virus sp.]|nr:MAG: hypothetical protein Unbinned5350contig1001_31 [Prokaryotic dsDNA virus sp.]
MRRFVYLMERNPTLLKWILGHFAKVREIKIGVAKDSSEREKQVDRGIKGKVVLLNEFKVNAATTVEKGLHIIFKDESWKPPTIKKGSGETEFFKLSNYQIGKARRKLRNTEGDDNGDSFVLVLMLGIFLIILFHVKNQ